MKPSSSETPKRNPEHQALFQRYVRQAAINGSAAIRLDLTENELREMLQGGQPTPSSEG